MRARSVWRKGENIIKIGIYLDMINAFLIFI